MYMICAIFVIRFVDTKYMYILYAHVERVFMNELKLPAMIILNYGGGGGCTVSILYS